MSFLFNQLLTAKCCIIKAHIHICMKVFSFHPIALLMETAGTASKATLPMKHIFAHVSKNISHIVSTFKMVFLIAAVRASVSTALAFSKAAKTTETRTVKT